LDVPVFLRAVLLIATGAGAVAFELAAVKSFTSWFGSTVEAAAVVVAVFLGALAVGARFGGRIADRVDRPVRLFGVVAIAGGVAAIAAPRILTAIGDGLLAWTFAEEPLIQFAGLLGGAVLVVGPPALLLGATLPALTSDAAAERSVPGLLYAANTFGGVVGVGLAGFLLIERIGNSGTAIAAGLLIVAAGVGALAAGRESGPRAASSNRTERLGFGVGIAALTGGFVALALQMMATRLLLQYLHGSAWSFAAILAIFLIGVAIGGALGARMVNRLADGDVGAAVLLATLGPCVALVGPVVVLVGGSIEATAMRGIVPQLLLSLAVLPATIVSGALFAVLLGPRDGSRHAGTRVGRVTLWNTIGGIAGSLLAAFVILPELGARDALLVVSGVALLGALAVSRRGPALVGVGLGAVVVAASLLPADLRALPTDPVYSELVHYAEGRSANVSVFERPGGGRPVLYVNRTSRQGGGADGRALERKQGMLPVALKHGDVRSALVLGVGTGGTVEGLLDAGVSSIHAVELVEGVLDALPFFSAGRGELALQPSVQLFHEDAVTFASAAKLRYDLVVGDLFFPWQDGAGRLYSLEHFRAVKERLDDGGLYCQWLPLYQLRWEDFGLVARTFARAFPQVWMMVAEASTPNPMVALIGSVDRITLSPERLNAMFADPRRHAAWEEVGLVDAHDVFALFLGDQYSIDAAFTSVASLEDESIITLDRPLVEYRAARTEEVETVLALNNLHNVAMTLGGALMPYIELATDLSEEARNKYEVRVNRRMQAQTQFTLATYWRLRRTIERQDPAQLEEKETKLIITGLQFDPQHRGLNRAAANFCAQRLSERRFGDVVQFGTQVIALNSENSGVARALGTAYLLLGEVGEAVVALEHTVSVEGGDPANVMLLGMARYLGGDDEGARADLESAYADSREGFSALAFAMRAALLGDYEAAEHAITPMLDHPVWGVLAKRAKARFPTEGAVAPREGR